MPDHASKCLFEKIGKTCVSYLSIHEDVLISRKRGGSDPGAVVLIPRCVLVWPSSPRAHVLLPLIRGRFPGQIEPVRLRRARALHVPTASVSPLKSVIL